jgi:hypothetical protein
VKTRSWAQKSAKFDPLDPNFVNLFEIEVSGNPNVYSRGGDSRIYFDSGDSCIGTIHDNPTYFKQYILRESRKVIDDLLLREWKQTNGP